MGAKLIHSFKILYFFQEKMFVIKTHTFNTFYIGICCLYLCIYIFVLLLLSSSEILVLLPRLGVGTTAQPCFNVSYIATML